MIDKHRFGVLYCFYNRMLGGWRKGAVSKMKTNNEQTFGEYAEMLRKQRGKSLRETAKAIGVSNQFYSEIEKGRRSALTPERLEIFKTYLELDKAERASTQWYEL